MPGVPPNAGNILKKVFKGIFKRDKKNKQDGADTAATSTSAQPPQQQQLDQPSTAPAQSQTPQIDTKAPQLPPLANASPLQGATESSRPVPPTHPLATGEHSKPTEAVPQKVDADPVPSPPLGGGAATASAATPATTAGLKEPEKLGASNAAATKDVSPPVSAMDNGDAPKSGAVSAISNEQSKTDSAADGVVAEPVKVEESEGTEFAVQPVTMEDQPTKPTWTTDPPPAPGAPENIPPAATNGTYSTNATSSSPSDATTATTAPTAASSTAATTDAKPDISDEKMPASMEEPPTIKAVRAAPGMSATSGPLEDFPEGGDAKYQ